MKSYLILIILGVQGISIVLHQEKMNKLITELQDNSFDYEGCESDMDYYLRSVELKDNKYINVPDSVALLAAEHPHIKIAATIECAGGYLNIELD